MKPIKIAVIGCGTAGLAAAAFLKQDGHDVRLFERFEAPRPVGAGLLLQPTGLACLACLGLDEKAIASGAPINHLFGKTVNGTTIFDISYATLKPDYFGLGIHRSTLFTLLYDEVARLNISVQKNCSITATTLKNNQRFLKSSDNHEYGPYDLIVDASGMRSQLRNNKKIKINKLYPYGAIWGVVSDPGQAFGKDHLNQRYDGAHTMIGMLAIGKEPDDQMQKCAFFWSLPPGGYEAWLKTDINIWKQKILNYWPELEPFMKQINHHDNLTFAEYSDIVMKEWHEDRLVFIGDAAHNTSPQLGQGANLALMDALMLSRSIKAHDCLNEALYNYTKARKSHIYFYQTASRWLTPFFQSHNKFAGVIRDLSFGLLCKTPYVKTEMLRTLAGIKNGLFRHINPGDVHKKYDLNNF